MKLHNNFRHGREGWQPRDCARLYNRRWKHLIPTKRNPRKDKSRFNNS